MITINRNPSRRELLVFGLLLAVFFTLAGFAARGKFDSPSAARILWIGGGALTLLHFAAPPVRRHLYLGWMYAAYPIGWTVSHLLLGITFYLVITPVGLLLRILGRDPMSRKPDPSAATYWVEHRPDRDPSRYFRQL